MTIHFAKNQFFMSNVREGKEEDGDKMDTKNPWKVIIRPPCTRPGFQMLYWTGIEHQNDYEANWKDGKQIGFQELRGYESAWTEHKFFGEIFDMVVDTVSMNV